MRLYLLFKQNYFPLCIVITKLYYFFTFKSIKGSLVETETSPECVPVIFSGLMHKVAALFNKCTENIKSLGRLYKDNLKASQQEQTDKL